VSTVQTAAGPTTGRAPQRRRQGAGQRQTTAGWLFTAPVLVLLGLFLFIPILMALWVSFTDWTGRGSPFAANVQTVGTENYQALLTQEGLSRQDFMTSLRNTFC
jgi:multiple sugar transport system permease protein